MSPFDALWEMNQHARLHQVSVEASKASTQAKESSSRVTSLEHAVDRLLLISRALWEIVQKHHPVDDEYLMAKIQEIDLRDGVADGKLKKRTPCKCQDCGRTLCVNHFRCLYCGSTNLSGDPFDAVR